MEEKQSASVQIQRTNRTAVYQILRARGNLSKRDMVDALQLSLPTVTQNINTLMKEDLVREADFQGNTGGRRARRYQTNDEARYAVGLDITLHHICAVVVNMKGNIIAHTRECHLFEQSDAYARKLGQIVEAIIVKSKIVDRSRILGVGIGVPGLVTPDNQTVFFGAILNFTGETCAQFAKYIPYKAALYNDAKAAGIAECWSRGVVDSAFYIMLSTNVGGALILNNHVFRGNNLRTGEVGHLTIHPGGKQCYCGQVGCSDAYLSATVLSSYTEGNLDEFFRKLEQKDEGALALWDTYLDDLALTANDVQSILDMKIILGGYVGGYLGSHMGALKSRAAKLNPFEKNGDYLEECRYTTNSIAAGAAISFISKFVNSI